MKKLLMLWFLAFATILGATSYGKNKVNAVPQDWATMRTMHFDIYFPAGEDEFGKTVALMAEDIYYYLKDNLKYPLISRIPIIFYSSKTDFQATNIIYPLLSEGVGGFTESLRNRVAVPFDGSYGNLEKLLVHELTHAYVNALDSRIVSAVESLRPGSFPFWFSEGLPEYLSIGREDDYNNMFIMDMVVNDKSLALDYSSGYLAYRLGENFLGYIAEVYGRDKVSEYFYSIRSMNNLEEATKRVFGMRFEELESRWKYQLKRDYYPVINSHLVPDEAMERRSYPKEDGSYMNFSPRFSPDGSRYVYFSDAGARLSVWMAGSHGFSKPKKIITGEKSGDMEEFYFRRSNLSWFPDGARVAFSAKSSTGDRIHILDVDKAKLVQSIKIPQLSAIFELDVSPDGKYIVLSAQEKIRCDLYLYHIESGELTQLTDDGYFDAQPRFSPDGMRVVFSSERVHGEKVGSYGYFTHLRSGIFELDTQSGEIVQVSDGKNNAEWPMYLPDGRIAYVDSAGGISNLYLIDLEGEVQAPITNLLCGTFNADLSPQLDHLLVSNYFDGAWNLYYGISPLNNLLYESHPGKQKLALDTDIDELIDLSELEYFGARKATKSTRPQPAYQEIRRPYIGGFEPTLPDSNRISANYSWDERPQSPSENVPKIKKYRPSFALDTLWGGLAYSSSYGVLGSVELGLSDLMGDHGIGINLGLSDRLKETNIVLSYIYLKRRTDLGGGVYNLYDETYLRHLTPRGWDYYRYRQYQSGAYGILRYPFSRFARVEFDNMLYKYQLNVDYLPNQNIDSGVWIKDVESMDGVVYTPGVAMVFDNALYGSTGPMLGTRAMYSLQKSFAKEELDHTTHYCDLRKYILFSRRYSLAMRLNGGYSHGSSPARFSLGGYSGVRALPYNLAGSKKALSSVELRFPLIDSFSMAFPLPITIGNIRGSAYIDAGAVWDESKHFRGMKDGRLEDIKLGYGFGPRLNLGYFVLKMDVSWQSDLTSISKPQIFLSLSEDF